MNLHCDESALRGRLSYNQPLREMNSWGVGGACDCFYAPSSVADLRRFLRNCIDKEPVYWLGMGSNVLIRDGGIRGVVISLRGRVRNITHRGADLVADAGASCARLARYCAEHSLAGLEFLAGVPGTVGGALFMNAGAFGRSVWDYATAAETIDRSGALRYRGRHEFSIGYRQTRGVAGEWFVRGHFSLSRAMSVAAVRKKILSLLKRRKEAQPIGHLSCGSVFRNPRGDHAARLVEACGLKSYSIGGAQVSDKHANFIINADRATADEIEKLICHVRRTVLAKTGVELLSEVHIIGEKRDEKE